MATEANALGAYLRARRQQVRPEDVGLIPGARRRVAGLRREELAMLAGISAEYYLRLEVGRDPPRYSIRPKHSRNCGHGRRSNGDGESQLTR